MTYHDDDDDYEDDFPVQRRKMQILREKADLGIGFGRPISRNTKAAKARRAKYLREHGNELKHRSSYKRDGIVFNSKTAMNKYFGSKTAKKKSGSKKVVKRAASKSRKVVKKPASKSRKVGSKTAKKKVVSNKTIKGMKAEIAKKKAQRKPRKLSDYNIFVQAYSLDLQENDPNLYAKLVKNRKFMSQAAAVWNTYKLKGGPNRYYKSGKKEGRYLPTGETGQYTRNRRAIGFGRY